MDLGYVSDEAPSFTNVDDHSPKHDRLNKPMDDSSESMIRQVLDDARAKGRDHITQTELAVRAGQQVRPDITAAEILAVVRLLQHS